MPSGYRLPSSTSLTIRRGSVLWRAASTALPPNTKLTLKPPLARRKVHDVPLLHLQAQRPSGLGRVGIPLFDDEVQFSRQPRQQLVPMHSGSAQRRRQFLRRGRLKLADERVGKHIRFLSHVLRLRRLGLGPVGMDDAPSLFLSLVDLSRVPARGHRPDVPHQDIGQDRGVAARLHLWLGHFIAVEQEAGRGSLRRALFTAGRPSSRWPVIT